MGEDVGSASRPHPVPRFPNFRFPSPKRHLILMQPAIPSGTILQNRYRILSLLGQGGFGRTYLAEDQGRFNERCALKEFIPSQTSPHAVQKSQELFQREAAILYQIQHPQIPQFRATFQQQDRLFLVQDYVAGSTYRTLLKQYWEAGRAFSQGEVLQLLQQLLPVLDYIHASGIIHRDISPENIIRREYDRAPVLIDFGVVKELATLIQSPQTIPAATTVGKLGYAPSEQMQTGRAYPSSDLYALAVTSVVLLTGREPQELFDDVKQIWHWERFVADPVNPELARVLNRMLSHRPGDRYQYAKEVALVLSQFTPIPVTSSGANKGASELATVAIAQGKPTTAAPDPDLPNSSISGNSDSLLDNPIAIAAGIFLIVLLSGLGSWSVVRSILNLDPSDPTPTASPLFADVEPDVASPNAIATPNPTQSPTPDSTKTPTSSPSPSSTPSPGATSTPVPGRRPSPQAEPPPPQPPIVSTVPLTIANDVTTSVEGTVDENEIITYVIQGEAGQQLSAQLRNVGVLMNVWGPDRQAIGASRGINEWNGTLPESGQYAIELFSLPGYSPSNFKLDIRLGQQISQEPRPRPEPEPPPVSRNPPEPSAPDPMMDPTLAPVPAPEPEPRSQPVPVPAPEPRPAPIASNGSAGNVERLFLSGGGTTQVEGRTTGQKKRYLVNVQRGQILKVSLVSGAVGLDIRYPNGELVQDGAMLVQWQNRVSESGDYTIDVSAGSGINYEIEIGVSE